MIAPDGKVRQHWDPLAPLGPDMYQYDRPAGLSKMLINTLLLGIECLPKGGDLTLTSNDVSITVTAEGENANMSAEAKSALDQSITLSDLAPKFTHPYLTGLFGQYYSMPVTCESADNGCVTLSIALPSSD